MNVHVKGSDTHQAEPKVLHDEHLPLFSPGVRLMMLAALAFAGMHGFVKSLVGFHVFEIIFFRSIITAFLCMFYLKAKGISLRGNNQKYLFLRSFFGMLTMLLFFVTLQRMPMGASVSLKYLSPVFTAVFAVIFLKERISVVQWLCFIAAFMGVLLLKGFDVRIDTTSLILGITGAVFGGLVYVMIRKIGMSEHPMVIINHFMIFTATLAGLAMIPLLEEPHVAGMDGTCSHWFTRIFWPGIYDPGAAI